MRCLETEIIVPYIIVPVPGPEVQRRSNDVESYCRNKSSFYGILALKSLVFEMAGCGEHCCLATRHELCLICGLTKEIGVVDHDRNAGNRYHIIV